MGIFPEFRRRLDQRLRVDIGDAKALDVRHQLFETSHARPVFLVRRRGRAVADARDHGPIGEAAVRPRSLGDGVDDELCGHAAGDDHRAAGEEGRPVDGAAPKHRPVPARGALARIERLAHQRVNAVGAHQHVAARGRPMRAMAVEEIGAHAAFILAKMSEAMAGMDARLAEPGAYRLVDDRLQPAAMDGELRHLVAGIGAAQLAPDLLPEAVGVEQLVGSDPHRVEAIEQPQLRQFLDRMGQRVDADAELTNGVRLLVDFAVDAAGVQHERGGETPDAAADNDDLHRPTHEPTRNSRRIMGRKVDPVQRFSPDVVDGAPAATPVAYLLGISRQIGAIRRAPGPPVTAGKEPSRDGAA